MGRFYLALAFNMVLNSFLRYLSMLAPGKFNHSESGKNDQFWFNENSQHTKWFYLLLNLFNPLFHGLLDKRGHLPAPSKPALGKNKALWQHKGMLV